MVTKETIYTTQTTILTNIKLKNNCISVLMVSVVDCGFELQSGQTKDCKIGMCCFPAKHATLRRKIKDWLARNQDNVSQ
jgi:hypothetical protein